MTFFVSEELKDRVSEDELGDVYHEEKDVDIVAIFYCDKNDPYQCNVSSIEKNPKQKILTVEFDIGTNEELITDLFLRKTLPRLELKILQTDTMLFHDIDAVVKLVKIKKIIERNSYFARILIAL